MKMPPYTLTPDFSKVGSLILFKMLPNYGEPHFNIRPCKRTYEDIVSTDDRVDFGPACYCFDEKDHKGIEDSEIICMAALEGVEIDFELVETYDGEFAKLIDLRKHEVIWQRGHEPKK